MIVICSIFIFRLNSLIAIHILVYIKNISFISILYVSVAIILMCSFVIIINSYSFLYRRLSLTYLSMSYGRFSIFISQLTKLDYLISNFVLIFCSFRSIGKSLNFIYAKCLILVSYSILVIILVVILIVDYLVMTLIPLFNLDSLKLIDDIVIEISCIKVLKIFFHPSNIYFLGHDSFGFTLSYLGFRTYYSYLKQNLIPLNSSFKYANL